ncbi:MAG: leucine-rich repeat domain-containing protein, partial [Ruminiclostridium sp.]|nr:leucine-rich repeat domain-containing protein [Ruminiclostridium sp.]
KTLQTGYDRTGDAAIKAKLDELLALAGAAEAVTTAAKTTTAAETTTTTTPEETTTTEETTVEEEPEEEKWWDSYDFVDFDDLSSYAGTEENIVVRLTKAQITPGNIELLRSMDVFGVSTQDNDLTNEDAVLMCSLTGIRYLDLPISSYISDYSTAFELTELKYLTFGTVAHYTGSSPVIDISGIKNLKNLNKLMIWNTTYGNQVVGVENIGELKELREVSFGFGAFGVNYDPHSLDFLFELPKLTEIDLQYSSLKDISFLSGFTQLTDLTLDGNPIEDYSPLYSLKKLKYLRLLDYNGNGRPITEDELEQLKQNLPDCSITT